MKPFFRNTSSRLRSVSLLAIIGTVLLVSIVSGYGYSQDYEGYLGETITLHGVSYTGDSVYLFMTGPGLPANGVPLTDTSKRADQGAFTVVGLNTDQTWSYKWDTARLENHIDPGTYLVYAVNAPADASSLTGHSYQTLSVYLKDSSLAKDRVSTGAKYSVNLADDGPVTTVVTTATTVPPTPSPTTEPPMTTLTTEVPGPVPTKKSPATPLIVIGALTAAGGLFLCRRNNEY